MTVSRNRHRSRQGACPLQAAVSPFFLSFGLALCGLILGLLTAGASPVRAADPAPSLTIGMNQFPRTLHPSLDSMAATAYVLGFTRRPITAYNADWKLVCLLCERVPTLENGDARFVDLPKDVGDHSGRGMEVTFRLPEKAAWADGTPITSQDVVFSWQVGRHPLTGFTAAESYRRILDVKVQDARTFTFVLDRVSFSYNSTGDFQLLPKHIEDKAFADPASYRQNSAYVTAPTTAGLWFGPWRLRDMVMGSHITLEKNPLWWGQPGGFDTITIKAIENTSALEANLLSGGVQMIAGEVGLAVDQALAFEQRNSKSYRVIYRPALYYEHLEPRLDAPQLADRRVRQALLLAIDRQSLSDRLFGGKTPVALTAVSPLDQGFDGAVTRYPFDPVKAKALLDQAGWRMGSDGVRSKDGARLSIDLQTTAGDRTRERVQQALQAMWKAVGVEAVIRNQPARVLFGETLDKRQFTGLALFAWISTPDNPPRSTLHCEQIPSSLNQWTGQNFAGYCNPEMDSLLDRLETELDPAARRALWSLVQKLYADDLPALPLYFRAEPHILPVWLEGVTPTGHMHYSSLWAEQWRDQRQPRP